MVFRVVIGALVSAVVMMIWGFVFWTILPTTRDMMRPLAHDGLVVAAMRQELRASGVYFSPMVETAPGNADDPQASEKAWQAQHRKGPIVQLFFQRQGAEPMAPAVFVQGFIHYAVSALLAGIALAWAAPRLVAYGSRVGFVLLIGLFAAVALNLGKPIWFNHPWDYTLATSIYDVVNGLLMGLVLGLFVRPARLA